TWGQEYDTPFNKKDKGKVREKEKEVVDERGSEETPADITKVKSALDLLADEAEARGTRPPSAEAEADAEGDGDALHGVDMEDGTEVLLGDSEPVNGRQTRSKGKHKALADSQPEEPEAEEGRADGSRIQPNVDEFHPPASSAYSCHDEYPYQQPAQPYWGAIIRKIVDARAPIDITPRASASRSPAPSDVQHASAASRNGSRGPRPQPLAAAGTSVLASSLSGEIVEDQGPSVLLTSRIDGVKFITEDPPRRTRSPYIKWTKEEDDLLAKAFSMVGKLDLASPETNAAAEFLSMATGPPTDTETDTYSQSTAAACTTMGDAPLVRDKGLPASDVGVGMAHDDLDEDAEADIDMGEEME
ncbi:hypothetical protein BU17DRAFT_103946, partial [Hysterangium stoloniferum]